MHFLSFMIYFVAVYFMDICNSRGRERQKIMEIIEDIPDFHNNHSAALSGSGSWDQSQTTWHVIVSIRSNLRYLRRYLDDKTNEEGAGRRRGGGNDDEFLIHDGASSLLLFTCYHHTINLTAANIKPSASTSLAA